MSKKFELTCLQCHSSNVVVFGTTDQSAVIICEDCGNTEEGD